jgi:hypothetical protein
VREHRKILGPGDELRMGKLLIRIRDAKGGAHV